MSVTKTDVENRIEDWLERIDRLYAHLDEWVDHIPGMSSERGSVTHTKEHLMQKFGIAPPDVQTYGVFRSGHGQREKRLMLVPTALWIVGANGRIDVTTSKGQYMLVDAAGRDGTPSEWRLVHPTDRRPLVPLTKAAFEALLTRGTA